MRTRNLIIGGVALVMGLAAVGSAAGGSNGSPSTPAAPAATSAAAPATSAPAAGTKTTPATDASHWQAFTLHESTSLHSASGLMTAFSADLVALDVESAKTSGATWDRFIRSELSWLDDNPPDACYADVHAGLTDVFADYREANRLVLPALDEYPNGNTGDVDHASELMSGATAKLNVLNAALTSANEACTT